jgi:Na+-transporting methylmalonyl-CoA/oxaloacetate decarboxylase gamma subunit
VQYVHFLNLEYFISRSWEFLGGLSPAVAALPTWAVALGWGIIFLGMGLSLVLLVLVIYTHLMMVQTEHEGFHALEERAVEEMAHARGPEGETQARIRTRWDDIVALTSSANENDWRRAILEADIMLSDALHTMGYEGPTVADQLRAANPIQMTTLDLAWQAHKVRNRVAHDGEKLGLTERDVRATIDQFRRVFEELKVI